MWGQREEHESKEGGVVPAMPRRRSVFCSSYLTPWPELCCLFPQELRDEAFAKVERMFMVGLKVRLIVPMHAWLPLYEA
jgi:hypothetical protein